MTSGFDAVAFDALRRGRFGRPLRALRTTGSTNADAVAWAVEGAPEGAVIVAEHQTAGRGRRGRSWSSRQGLSLLFSVVLRPQLELDRLGLVTTAFGVAVAEAADAEALGLGIKWPNDIVAGDRKLAGILVESRVSGRIADVAVGGVGLNVGWADAELPEEVSASAVTLAEVRRRARLDPPAPPEQMLASLLDHLERAASSLAAPEGRRAVVRRAAALST
ncbi:MAG TPA: biotin--[acetyl-CoA-carboxylase] ligase, partial [Actinomycetota bacterium]|nr:biotin--[acetyl-CoA-carboxylase] ligase [Actinomycetota bacterium]